MFTKRNRPALVFAVIALTVPAAAAPIVTASASVTCTVGQTVAPDGSFVGGTTVTDSTAVNGTNEAVCSNSPVNRARFGYDDWGVDAYFFVDHPFGATFGPIAGNSNSADLSIEWAQQFLLSGGTGMAQLHPDLYSPVVNYLFWTVSVDGTLSPPAGFYDLGPITVPFNTPFVLQIRIWRTSVINLGGGYRAGARGFSLSSATVSQDGVPIPGATLTIVPEPATAGIAAIAAIAFAVARRRPTKVPPAAYAKQV